MKHGTSAETVWPNGADTPSDRASDQRSMSSNTLTAQNGADTIDESTVKDHIPTGADRLGIDNEGRIHYWHRAGHEMIVVEPIGTADGAAVKLEIVTVSPGSEFRGYVKHAADIAGFDSLAYDEGWLGLGGN